MVLAATALGIAASVRFGVVGGPDYREALVVGTVPFSLNPLIGTQDRAVHDIGHLLYRSLLRLDATAYPRPDLAQSYSVSSDGLTYTAVLAPRQRWSSGAVITPLDVVATMAFVQSSPVVDRSVAALVQGVKVSATGSTIRFTLPAPRASFAAALTQLPVLPLGSAKPAQVAADAAHPNVPLATSGEYRVTKTDDRSIALEANPFASPRAHLARVEFDLYTSFSAAAAAFTGGGSDALLATTPAQRAKLAQRSGSHAHPITTFQFVDLLFNERIPGLDDPVVRHAVATTVDRTALVRGALETDAGTPQVGAITRGLPWVGGAAPPPAASPATAAAALQQDGWTTGPQGMRVRGSTALDYLLTVPQVDPLPTVASEVARQLGTIGIRVRVAPVPAAQFMTPDLTQHDFQLALGDWDNGPDPDVSVFWRSNATPPQGFNVSGAPADPFLDQSLDVLASDTDPQARVAAATAVSRDLAADVPATFLYTPELTYLVHGSMSMTIPAAGGSAARFDAIASWHH